MTGSERRSPGGAGPRRWAAVLVLLATLVLAGWLVRAPGGGSAVAGPAATEPVTVSDPGPFEVPVAGTGRDPLTPAEIDVARRVAPVPAGSEFLSVELAPGATRRAAVLHYEYAGDRLVKRVVDLAAGRVDETFGATGRQPPATAGETATAYALLLADPAGNLLRDRFRAATGAALTRPDQLTVEAQIHIGRPGSPAAECGAHRCVTLLPRPAGQPYLDLTDVVVDLSGRAVVRLT
jgi:hypothetical protein